MRAVVTGGTGFIGSNLVDALLSQGAELELVAAVARAAGIDPAAFAPEFRPARAGEVLRSCLDVTRVRTDLRLRQPTTLDAGLVATLDWMRARRTR